MMNGNGVRAPDDRSRAAVDMIGRTGAVELQIRLCEEEHPSIWIAAACWRVDEKDHWDAAAAGTPDEAIYRLCDQVIDGGECRHCHRPTGFNPDWAPGMPITKIICWYTYDPELKIFRRSCE